MLFVKITRWKGLVDEYRARRHCRWEKKTYTQNEAVLWHHHVQQGCKRLVEGCSQKHKIGDVKGKSSINIVDTDMSRRRRQSAVTV
jgi:hypothetical protein